MRGATATRAIKLLILLAAHRTGLTVAEMAAELGVSPRTLYRDLQVLEEAGLPLEIERQGRRCVYRVLDAERWRLGALLGLSEVLALHLAADLMRAHGGDPWKAAIEEAMKKIDLALPARYAARLEEGLARVSASRHAERRYTERPEILSAVTTALDEQRPLHVSYATPGRPNPTPRVLWPLHLYCHDRGLYLLARDSRSEEVRTFLVDRITLARLGEGRFDPPEDFDPATYFGDAFAVHRGGELIHLRLCATPRVAHLFEERRWHHSQRNTRTRRGLIVRMRVLDTPELRAWIQSFGSQVVVEAPASLAEVIARDAEAVVRAHARARGRARRDGGRRKRRSAPKTPHRDQNNPTTPK
ncbi:MAG: transcriptional regulator [Deltaproteobacteria bacterium]|nr:MAG: transcriptional regulator [Deltaproteobacteria bacterium]